MDKRYQVFISSTYSDLKEERNKVMQTIMALDCIPAGMELFPANDSEQFEFIKKIIDDCDYYVLIIGGRYGSISDNGISYTEKEFDYALSKNIPIIAFLHDNINTLTVEKSDTNAEIKAKLIAFRDRAATGRLVQFWKTADELNAQVAISLTKTIKTHPAIGWVRADKVSSAETNKDLIQLMKENKKLKEQNLKLSSNTSPEIQLSAINIEHLKKWTNGDDSSATLYKQGEGSGWCELGSEEYTYSQGRDQSNGVEMNNHYWEEFFEKLEDLGLILSDGNNKGHSKYKRNRHAYAYVKKLESKS